MRVLIVDDEPHARAYIRAVLETIGDVDVVAECGGGAEAVAAIDARRPDAAFLDIAMPEIDGFDVIEMVGPDRMPPVVFITAHDDGAVRAFELAAVDYLLKPIDEERLVQAVERLRLKLASQSPAEVASALRAALDARGGSPFARRIMVRTEHGMAFVHAEDVDWLEADGKHVIVHVGEVAHRVRSSLAAIAERLDPARFARVHRSSVVNLERVREIQPWYGGDFVAILTTGAQVRVSRNFRDNILRTTS
jgi:two-component system LytT family response regulator